MLYAAERTATRRRCPQSPRRAARRQPVVLGAQSRRADAAPLAWDSFTNSERGNHAPPALVFQIGSGCASVASRNQRVIVIFCCV